LTLPLLSRYFSRPFKSDALSNHAPARLSNADEAYLFSPLSPSVSLRRHVFHFSDT
jgi:hypothetical protein